MEATVGTSIDGTGMHFHPDPQRCNQYYISLNYHRCATCDANRDKGCWAPHIARATEYEIFCMAYVNNWCNSAGDYWSFYQRCETDIGTCRERLCKFPHRSNMTDPWHGYPVSPNMRRGLDAPPAHLVQSWIDAGAVRKVIGRRIQGNRY